MVIINCIPFIVTSTLLLNLRALPRTDILVLFSEDVLDSRFTKLNDNLAKDNGYVMTATKLAPWPILFHTTHIHIGTCIDVHDGYIYMLN